MTKPSHQPPRQNQSSPRIVDAENDFPFAKVTRVVVGSAHAVTSKPDEETSLLHLLQKLVDHCHVEGRIPTVEIERKS